MDRIESLKESQVDEAIQTNVSSTIKLFQSFISAALKSFVKQNRLFIVNVSSLAAVRAFDMWSVYCTGKAARDHFFRCLLEEYKSVFSNLQVLNYAPGPLDTDMQQAIRERMPESELKQQFIQMHSTHSLISPTQSAHVLIRILKGEISFENGGHVDYYDVC